MFKFLIETIEIYSDSDIEALPNSKDYFATNLTLTLTKLSYPGDTYPMNFMNG